MRFYTYRNGSDSIEQRLKRAVALFNQMQGGMPGVIVVHPSELDDAQAAAQALELAAEVRSTGGCLSLEAWVGEGEKDG